MSTKRIFSHLLILTILVLLALAPAGKVSASAPVVEYFSLDINYMLEEQPCPGIEVWDHEVFTFRATNFYNNKGELTTVKYHITDGMDNFYNPANPGVVLSGAFGGNAELDLQTGNWINASGITAHVTIPGYGRVVMFTGHWLVYPTIHLGGLYTFDDPADSATFCALLGAH